MIRVEEALEYHRRGRKGKIELGVTKPCRTQKDLSLAYTPGVAEPSRYIHKDPALVFEFTARANLVAVVSNGTAVLGLGNIGPLAAKPVMEGKAVLFKRFADIDAFDIELDTQDPDLVIQTVRLLEPTFGGVNLEDIKAPECFYIEEELKKQMKIPVFHDDQHGTAIITGAAFLNSCELTGRKPSEARIVINGAGAAGIALGEFFIRLGAKRENILLCDTRGVIYTGRTEGMNPYKERFARNTPLRTLREAMRGADVFIGLSIGNIVDEEMVKSMADKPMIFAMANPDPEIPYEVAKRARPDAIIATGRSDYPNQVNNVLGFPFIFRGALDVRATQINEEMKVAAAHALADLTRESVPESVMRAYGNQSFEFGPDYVIPKPFDPRVLLWEAPAVARAAMETGVAQVHMDLDRYRQDLEARLARSQEVMRVVIDRARANPRRIVFPEGEEEKILKAAATLVEEEIAHPILLGNPEAIRQNARRLHLSMKGITVIHPETSPQFEEYAQALYQLRKRKGVTLSEASQLLRNRNYFGAMMVHMGDADGLIAGVNQHYPDTLRPALQIIKPKKDTTKVSGVFIMILKDRILIFSDTTVNIEATSEELVEFACQSAELARKFGIQPRISFLSFSNFGSVKHPLTEKVRKAVDIIHQKYPDLIADGEMQADTALVQELLDETYPFSQLKGGPANILIFPDLTSGNIGYKLVERLAGAEAIGPILLGMDKPVHILQRGCDVSSIVNMAAIAVVDAQEVETRYGSHGP